MRLRLASAERLHDVTDLLAVAMGRPGHGIVVGHGGQSRPEIDEGEYHALRLLGNGAQSGERWTAGIGPVHRLQTIGLMLWRIECTRRRHRRAKADYREQDRS